MPAGLVHVSTGTAGITVSWTGWLTTLPAELVMAPNRARLADQYVRKRQRGVGAAGTGAPFCFHWNCRGAEPLTTTFIVAVPLNSRLAGRLGDNKGVTPKEVGGRRLQGHVVA